MLKNKFRNLALLFLYLVLPALYFLFISYLGTQFQDWNYSDELLDSCIKPHLFLQDDLSTYQDSNFGYFLLISLIHKIFGFSYNITIITTAFIFVVSCFLLFHAFRRIFGLGTSIVSAIIILSTCHIILRAVSPTTAITALVCISLILTILTHPISNLSATAIGLLASLSLLLYGAGTVSILPLIFFHLIIFRKHWSLSRILSLVSSGSITFLLVCWIRELILGEVKILSWGVDSIDSFKPTVVIPVLVRETFIKANSWYAFTMNKYPYLSWELSIPILLITALVILKVSGIVKIESKYLSSEKLKWSTVFILTYIGAAILASLETREIGVRRIYPAVMLLVPLTTMFYLSLARSSTPMKYLAYPLVLAAILLATHRSYKAINFTIEDHLKNNNRNDEEILSKVESIIETLPKNYSKIKIFFNDGDYQFKRYLACSTYFAKTNFSESTWTYSRDTEQQIRHKNIWPKAKLSSLEPSTAYIMISYQDFSQENLRQIFGNYVPKKTWLFHQHHKRKKAKLYAYYTDGE